MTDTSDNKPDSQLFRELVGAVVPLKTRPTTESRTPAPAPRPDQTIKDEQTVMTELLDELPEEAGLETGEELLFLRPGTQSRYLRRLRRGHFSVRDSLDLHHMNEAVATEAIRQFIEAAVKRNWGCIRIVHGKGLRSRDRPKLKILTNRLLRRHPQVLAFASCRPADGGTGAVSVLLKHRKSTT